MNPPGSLVVINDDNYREFLGHMVAHPTGLIPRDFEKHPVGSYAFAKPFDLPLIPRSEWATRLAVQQATNGRLSDVRERGMFGQRIPSRDQDGYGYCWAHSSTSACLLLRAVGNLPYADLSAFAVACIIKDYRNEGGWGAESLEWIAANGIPTSATWPQQGVSRSYDNQAMRAEAAQNKVTEWMDLDPNSDQYIDQLVTCLLLGIPVVVDYNWWSHSICAMDLVSIDANASVGSLQILIWNSWGDSWSQNGAGVLQGRKAVPDGAIAPRVINASKV